MDNERRNIGLYIIVVILMVLFVVFGCYAFYNKSHNNKNVDTSKVNEKNDSNLVSKIDNTKDWVYDAEYQKDVDADYYSTYYEKYYAKDIVVPYINVNSAYGENANKDIKKVFDSAIKTYNDGVKDKETFVDECNYKKYINDDSLSVVLTYGVGATDVVQPQYYIYNIDLKTGNKLSYEEIYKIAGLNSSNIEEKVIGAITKVLEEELKDLKNPEIDTDDGQYYPEETNFDTYNNKSIDNYKKSVNNNTLKYFLSSNKKLNIVVKLSVPAGIEEFDTIISVN